MKHILPLLLTSIAFFVITSTLFAQNDSSENKKSYFKAGVNYLSNAVYFGRKDSATVPYLRPSIGYHDKSGFSISGEASILVNPNEPKRIDVIEINAGYDFSISKLDAGIYASKMFYSNASYAVGSELKGLVGIYSSYNLGFLSLEAGGDILFSTNIDYSTSLGVSHSFERGDDNNKFIVKPTVQVMAGTQYFNEAYYENRKFTFPTTGNSSNGSSNSNGKGKGHSNSSNTGSVTTTTTVKTLTFYDKNRFTVLDYEISLPANYETKHWGFYLLPVVAIPTNAATFAIDNAIQKEKISTTFFVEVGAYVKF